MPLHLGMPHGQRGGQQDAAREARRQLAARMRNDWDYPTLPPSQLGSASEDVASVIPTTEALTIAQDQTHTVPTEASPAYLEELGFEPLGWCERTYSSVESDESEQSASESKAAASSTYKFESPDDIGAVLLARKAERRQRRQQRLREEMEWNLGLSHFVARRNAWTGAKVADTDTSDAQSRASQLPSHGSDVDEPTEANEHGKAVLSQTSDWVRSGDGTGREPLLPIPPPLLPSHPIRTRINPSTYGEIYSKIIIQARTPSVPINLSDVTGALVAGWKESGEWPPKPSAPEPTIAGRRKIIEGEIIGKHPHLRKGVQAVGRVLGLSGSGSATTPETPDRHKEKG